MVLPERVDDRCAHEAKVPADGREDERRDGEHEEVDPAERAAPGGELPGPARREHAEPDREDDDEDEREPEDGHRDPGEGDEVDDTVVPREGLHCGQGPGREGDGKGEDEARPEKDQGVRERRAEHVEDRCGVETRVPEIAAHGVSGPCPPALQHGAVQAV